MDSKCFQIFKEQLRIISPQGTKFLEKAFFVKWIGKPEHAFDIQENKLVDNQNILLFWQHRGEIYLLITIIIYYLPHRKSRK